MSYLKTRADLWIQDSQFLIDVWFIEEKNQQHMGYMSIFQHCKYQINVLK